MTLAEAGNDGRTAVRLNLRLKQAVKYVHRHHVVVCGLRNIHGADVIECCNTQHSLLNGRGVEPQAVIARMLAQISETKTNLLKLILHSK